MLEKIAKENKNPDLILFRNIATDEHSTGICYVTGGVHKVSKINRPFITLYLQDLDGVTIPGYIFDIPDIKASGFDLTEVTHSLVKISYTENYLIKLGMTLLIDKIEKIIDPPLDLLKCFVGQIDVQDKYDELVSKMSDAIEIRCTLPYTICSLSHVDYSHGMIGGLVLHYWEMLTMIQVYANKFNASERKKLYGTLLLYVFVHSNYIAAVSKGKDDITLVKQLTAAVPQYIEKLHLGTGSMEIVHMFFGYEPKDIYVRLVAQVSRDILRASKEIDLWKTLPVTREGNAGYGIIKRYAEEGRQ